MAETGFDKLLQIGVRHPNYNRAVGPILRLEGELQFSSACIRPRWIILPVTNVFASGESVLNVPRWENSNSGKPINAFIIGSHFEPIRNELPFYIGNWKPT